MNAEPAPLGVGEIRVLEYDTVPQRVDQALACRTRIIKLEDAQTGTQPYAALSYVWGDPTSTTIVICDGMTRAVTHNTSDALSVIWKAYPSEQIWVDALCIDQSNVKERNDQVSLMGDIYWSAAHVFIYLGPSLKGNSRFWTLLENFSSTGRFDNDEDESEFDAFMEGQKNDLGFGINDLIRRPWFRRAWTYQEIRLSNAAIAICGDRFMLWSTFLRSLQAFSEIGTFMKSFSALRAFIREQAFLFRIPNAVDKSHSRRSSRADQVPEIDRAPLLELLVDAWPRDSSDARDKVYAVTSPRLTSTAYVELRPDYDLDMQKTFIKVIKTHINNAKNLEFLKYAIGTCTSLDWPGRHPRHDGDRVLEKEGRWVPLRNRERLPLPPLPQDSENGMSPQGPSQTILSGSATLSSIPQAGQTSSHKDLPTWVCDWRVQGAQTKVSSLPLDSNHLLWKSRREIAPKAQSIKDFSRQLILRGCALARVCRYATREVEIGGRIAIEAGYRELSMFMELPHCALQKSLDQSRQMNRQPAPRAFQIRHLLTAKNLPRTNLSVLLLQTLLHDQSACHCAANKATTVEANSQRGDQALPDTKPELLRARCRYDTFPRSPVAELDWLFLLDGIDEAVILRPYIQCSSGRGAETRSEIGFQFVSVCPLTIIEKGKSWGQVSIAYGDIVLF